MKTRYLTGLLLLLVACSGGQTTGGTGDETTLQLKKAAADAKATHAAQGDACQEHGWYGDGECDRFCGNVDSVDCTAVSGGPDVACALFLEEPNGFCSRKAEDPCIGQDPDCETMAPSPTEPGDDPIICTAIAREPDGVCDASPEDPCAVYQDPDCSGGGGGAMPTEPTEPPSEPIICPAIALPADGVCAYDGKDICLFYADPDCMPLAPTDPGCTAPAEAADGVCNPKPNSGSCTVVDPDCEAVMACAEYIELSDGVCKRAANDPCIFQDPDCQ